MSPFPLTSRLRLFLLGLACCLLSALTTFGFFEVFFPVRLPASMRGKWVVEEAAELKGAMLEFFADGKMEGDLRGRAQVEGNRIRFTTGGIGRLAEVTEFQDILELSDRWFVLQDSRGEVIIMRRPDITSSK